MLVFANVTVFRTRVLIATVVVVVVIVVVMGVVVAMVVMVWHVSNYEKNVAF